MVKDQTSRIFQFVETKFDIEHTTSMRVLRNRDKVYAQQCLGGPQKIYRIVSIVWPKEVQKEK
jgi:hypothetical protein